MQAKIIDMRDYKVKRFISRGFDEVFAEFLVDDSSLLDSDWDGQPTEKDNIIDFCRVQIENCAI